MVLWPQNNNRRVHKAVISWANKYETNNKFICIMIIKNSIKHYINSAFHYLNRRAPLLYIFPDQKPITSIKRHLDAFFYKALLNQIPKEFPFSYIGVRCFHLANGLKNKKNITTVGKTTLNLQCLLSSWRAWTQRIIDWIRFLVIIDFTTPLTIALLILSLQNC